MIVSGLTGSAALNANRQLDRSMPSISSSVMRRRHSSNEKFGPPDIVPRWRWMARIQLAGRDRNASGDISTVGKPSTSDAKLAPMRPRSWYSGNQLTNTSCGPAFTAPPIARTLAIRLACDSTTPFGLPVLPEVYCRKPVSPGWPCTGENPAPDVCESSAGTMTCCSDSTWARSR